MQAEQKSVQKWMPSQWMPRRVYRCYRHVRDVLHIAFGYRKIRGARGCKAPKDGKIRILFIVQRTEVFNSVRPVFEAAAANDRCEAFLLPIPRSSLQQTVPDLATYPAIGAFCRSLGKGTVLDAYDPETNQYLPLDRINPDYIFLNTPYTDYYPEPYRLENLAANAKVCYIPYGFWLPNEQRYGSMLAVSNNTTLLRCTDFLFMDGAASAAYCRNKLWLSRLLSGNRVYELGFPRFGLLPVSQPAQRPRNLLWLPRWTCESQGSNNLPSHFFDFRELLPRYAEAKQDGLLVIRPHPLAFQNYLERGILSPEQISAYKARIAHSRWVCLDEKPSYEEAFRNADILVADYSSLVVEFAYLGKPVVYCGERRDLSGQVASLLDTFYYVHNWEELQKVLDDLRGGVDPLGEQRAIAVRQFRRSCRNAAPQILDTLLRDYDGDIQ